MAQGLRYETKNLSAATWPDFEALFLKHNGVWGGCWCMYGHGRTTFRIRGHAEEHRNAKRALVLAGKSHGVLVYLRGKPVGWCQFGPREELPRMDGGRNYRKLGLHEQAGPFWLITCFFADRDHRRQGVASAGLRGAFRGRSATRRGALRRQPAARRGGQECPSLHRFVTLADAPPARRCSSCCAAGLAERAREEARPVSP